MQRPHRLAAHLGLGNEIPARAQVGPGANLREEGARNTREVQLAARASEGRLALLDQTIEFPCNVQQHVVVIILYEFDDISELFV